MEEIKQQLTAIQREVGKLQLDFHALDKQAALTAQAVATLATNMALMSEAVASLKQVAERWRGIVGAGLFLGPVVGALVGMLVRVWLFGEPLTRAGGVIK
jgi:hypothetical protein